MSNKLSRRDFLKTSGLAGSGLALGGLGIASVAAQGTDVTIPSWWAPHEIEGAQAFFDGVFPRDGGGTTATYEYIGTDYFSKVFTNLVGTDPYDVITFNANNTPQFLERNVLLPLDDLIERDGYDLSDFDPKAIDQWTYDGQLYGLANDMGTFHCYFNVDLFEEAGLTPPSSTDSWTFDDLREWAAALTKTDGDQVVQYGFASGSNWNYELWANLSGNKVFNDDFSGSQFSDSVAAFEFYQSLMHEDNTAVKPGAIQTGVNDLFLAGQLAIMLEGTWQVGYLRSRNDEVNFTWDVGIPPGMAGAENYYIPNFTAGWVIPRVAPDVDASWEVMKAYASADFANNVMFTALSSLPTRISALEGAGFYQWPDLPPESITPEFYGLLLEHGLSRQEIGHTLTSAVTAELAKLDLIYSGEAAPADILAEIDAGLASALMG